MVKARKGRLACIITKMPTSTTRKMADGKTKRRILPSLPCQPVAATAMTMEATAMMSRPRGSSDGGGQLRQIRVLAFQACDRFDQEDAAGDHEGEERRELDPVVDYAAA